jgi:predicted O-methyltransferase YrrM
MPLLRTYDAAREKIVVSVRSAFEDRLGRWSDIQEYLPFLHDTARSYPGVRVLELGTRKGNSTLAFLAAAKDAGGHVWSADIINVDRDPEGMLPWARLPYWTFVHGDDMHPAVRAALPAKVDVLFIDTSHEYEHTLAELRAYMPRLAPGGTALFHDTKVQALDEYCAEAGLSWEELPGEYGLGVIRPGGEPEAARADRDGRARLGQPAAPGDVPAGLGEGRTSAQDEGAR